MRIRFFKIIFLFLLIFCGPVIPVESLAEGSKQLKPDTTKLIDLYIQNGGGYTCFATPACGPDQKLYVRIANNSEKVYLGFGNALTFRIKLNGITVYGPVDVTTFSQGYIRYYKQAIAGPDIISTAGYYALVFYPGAPGDYSIEFDPTTVGKFDITVIDTTKLPLAAIDGRLWSKDWGFNCYSLNSMGSFLGTQYIYSDDSIVTSIFYNEMRGWNFDVTSTSNGCYPPPVPFDNSCRSRMGNHHYAQYKIFLNNPDTFAFPTGTMGNIDSVNVTQECDGSFIISFWVDKPGSVQIEIDVNQKPGHQADDVTITSNVTAGTNQITWNGLDGLGNPVAEGTTISIKITYINGLTNLALYDVEYHVLGFIIQQIRPPGPPIATYWNDTLLVNFGGTTQLDGCFSSLPATGCHAWAGGVGFGLGSNHTVNTWWYAGSSPVNLGNWVMARGPVQPNNITGPASACTNLTAVYTVNPDPLPGSDPNRYEWILTDVTTGDILFDSVNQDATITINFAAYPVDDKKLKVRGFKAGCGFGPFGPGTDGILINTTASPVITNLVRTFNILNGGTTDILLQSGIPSTFTYTATATSLNLSGYSGGSQNPIQQTLTTSGLDPDTVIYQVVPYASPCYGDTTLFYVIVNPVPLVTNLVTSFTQCPEAITTISLLSNIPGVSFFWTATGSSPDVSGYSDGTGPVIAQTLINSGMTPQNVTYTVRDSIFGITGPPLNIVVTVNPKQLVSITVSPSSNPFCPRTSVNFSASAVNVGILPSYQWKVNGSLVGDTLSTYSYSPSDGDIVSCIVNSTIGCPVSNPVESAQLYMTAAKEPVINLTDKDYLCAGEPNALDAGSGFTFYLWQDGSTGRYYTATKEGLYHVTVTDSLGCLASDSVLLKVCDALIQVPDAFSPNGDGLNDEFKVVSSKEGIIVFSMYVYNRWGEMVFESSDINHGWNGIVSGRYASADTYVWKIVYQVSSQNGSSKTLRGTVTLIR